MNVTVLDEIVAGVKADLAIRAEQTPIDKLVSVIEMMGPAKNPMDEFMTQTVSLIAEVKRKSPSKGDLSVIEDPAALAENYQNGGASAISVLTEKRRFNGSLADLDSVRERVQIPVLRKDFMIDPYQFYEARAHGADLVLLIVAALSDKELKQYYKLATDLGMKVLVETHDDEEIDRALELDPEIIGINNRNLKTLQVDLNQFGRLSDLIPSTICKVAESGIFTRGDVQQVATQGANVILVGEALVKADNPMTAINNLIGW